LNALTTDTFLQGQIRIRQFRSGYRFSIDAILLADYVRPRPGDTIVDLGTGCGIVPLLLVHTYPEIRVYGIELQQALADLASENAADNRVTDRVIVIQEDIATLTRDRLEETVHTVVCNPPYRKADSGRLNPDMQRAIARHELRIRLDDILRTAKRLLDISGRLIMVYIADRAAELLAKMPANGFEPKRIRWVHSKQHAAASLLLVEAIRGGRPGLTVQPPLIIYDDSGAYTEELSAIFRGRSRQ